MPLDLTPERGLLFRITHTDNLPWLLNNGLHSAGSGLADPGFVPIGLANLIAKRTARAVPVPPGGVLADYVPFYFTPKSPMLLNIKTGYNEVARRSDDEIVILISSCKRMIERGIDMVFTDRHAYVATARWTKDEADLAGMIDWDILIRQDFARSDGYPDKMERYQAEALAHRHVPADALLGIGCASDNVKAAIEAAVQAAGQTLPVFVRQGWYF
ncbi:DUF4433 domain-containing protein [Phenylobacterium sp.]|jgi:hypothetical protein|uniref:type II toxin-antitoxin system toxin DNA ADP-ribosyl transferase DarT n=1 Tax=Phenylobacterium sp. TaxID=1871053 RepID=UPI0037C9A098